MKWGISQSCSCLHHGQILTLLNISVQAWNLWLNTPGSVKQVVSVGLSNVARAKTSRIYSLAGLKLHTKYSPYAKLSGLVIGIKFSGANLLLQKPTDAKLLTVQV